MPRDASKHEFVKEYIALVEKHKLAWTYDGGLYPTEIGAVSSRLETDHVETSLQDLLEAADVA